MRRVWVVSPSRAFANVVVNGSATPGAGLLSVTTGLQYISQPFAIQIQPAGVRASLSASVQGQPNLFPGATAVATVLAPSGPLSSSSLTLNLNDKTVPIVSTSGNQITFQIPAGTTTGLATLRLDVNGDRGFPIGIQIDNPPAQ